MRGRVRLQSLLCLGLFWQNLAVDQEGLADLERVDEMVLARIGRVGVNQYAQAAVIEHQPGYQRGEDLLGKGDLKHGAIVRADLRVMPVA